MIQPEIKESIIVWGMGKRSAMYSRWLMDNFRVEAYVADNMQGENAWGIPIISKEEIKERVFDKLVLTAESWQMEETAKEAEALLKGNKAKVISIDDLIIEGGINKYLCDEGTRQLEVIEEILCASDDELGDYDWMYRRVIRYGTFCFNNQNQWYKKSKDYCWSVYGLQQLPEEFAGFCNMLSEVPVSRAAEVGVYRGRSAYFMCAVLARKNPDLKYMMIDIDDKLDDYGRFSKVLPQLQKCIPGSSGDFSKEEFDFVFIDADHSYDASFRDYLNIGASARKLVVFHDIYAHEYDNENGGTVRTWSEVVNLTQGNEHRIFAHEPDVWMGIGCVLRGNVGRQDDRQRL